MDKTKRIIDMTEHPERYSEDELRQLLMDDEEGRKIYRTICELCAALDGSAAVATRRLSLVGKIAAVFVGVCLLSGLAYAAVTTGMLGNAGEKPAEEKAPAATVKVEKSVVNVQEEEPEITEVVKTYEDVTLKEIVGDLASFYNLNVSYKSDKAASLRLYFRLDTRRGLEQVINQLNSFDNINITINGDTLTVE